MTLPWIIYLADVSGSLPLVFFLVASILTTVYACWWAAHFETSATTSPPFRIAFIALLLFLCSALIPSKNTIYMMVGASVAVDVVKSDTAKKVMSLIEHELDKQLEKIKK